MKNHFVALGVVALVMFNLGCSSKDSSGAKDSAIDYYTCAMHPSVRQMKSGKCPICGMELIPVKKKGKEEMPSKLSQEDHSKHGSSPASNPHSEHGVGNPAHSASDVTISETSPFNVAPERLQAIGIRSDVLHKEKMHRLLRAPGMVTIDESTLRDVNVKTADGYIEKLFANYTGKKVKREEPLALILSEGWIETQQEYIRAYRSWRRTRVISPSENPVLLEQEFSRMRARLKVWDLSDQQIQELEKFALNLRDFDLTLRNGQGQGLSGLFELRSPIDGIVIEKSIIEGAKFEKGSTLFKLAGLSPIWIEAEFSEDQSPYIANGHEFDINFPAVPDLTAKAKVIFVSSQVNNETRRLKARFALENPQNKLLPGMYANVTCSLEFGEKLALPFDAVIPTGDRFVVFLDHGGGKLEPRYVQIGEKMGEYYEVLDGVEEGDRVITSANFLIDSESRIQGALKMWGGGSAKASNPHAGHGK